MTTPIMRSIIAALTLALACPLLAGQGYQIVEVDQPAAPPAGAPTLASATIPPAGDSITLAFNKAVFVGLGGDAGWVPTLSGGAAAADYSSGSGTSSLIYTLARTVHQGETGTIAYTQPGDGIEDESGIDLASIAGAGITNNSTQESVTYLIHEPFDGAGYSLTWSETSGTPDEDYVTTVLAGTQSLYMDGTTVLQAAEVDAGAAVSEVWVTFLYRPTVLPASNDRVIFFSSGTSGGGTARFTIRIGSGGFLQARWDNGGTSYTVAALSAGVTYLIGGYYRNSDKTVAVSFVAWTGSESLPTSGTSYATATSGAAGTAPRYFGLRQSYTTSSGGAGIFDEFKVADTNIWP